MKTDSIKVGQVFLVTEFPRGIPETGRWTVEDIVDGTVFLRCREYNIEYEDRTLTLSGSALRMWRRRARLIA